MVVIFLKKLLLAKVLVSNGHNEPDENNVKLCDEVNW